MDNRGSAAIGVVLILLVLGIGVSIGAIFLHPLFTRIRAPKTHTWILDNLEVIDQRWPDSALDEKLVDAGVRTWGKPLTVTLSQFTEDEDFSQTTWIFQRWGDTEVVMTIWGPGLDGSTYYIEVAQMGYGPFKVYFDDEEKVFLYHAGQNPSDAGAKNIGWFDILIESES